MNDLMIELDPVSIKTERITARHWQPEDAEAALPIYSHPEVTEFMPQARLETINQMRERISKIIERDSQWPIGIGSYASFERESGKLIGNLLIKPLPLADGSFTDEIEIGWHLARDFWGRGLATEGGRALLKLGFEFLALDVIYAVVKPENTKSIGVTERLGMQRLEPTDQYYGERLEFFRMKRSDWKGER